RSRTTHATSQAKALRPGQDRVMRKTNNIVGATWGRGNDARWKSPATGLSHRAWKLLAAIPTLPPPRRLLHSFRIPNQKGLSSSPSLTLQAHPSIGKD